MKETALHIQQYTYADREHKGEERWFLKKTLKTNKQNPTKP